MGQNLTRSRKTLYLLLDYEASFLNPVKGKSLRHKEISELSDVIFLLPRKEKSPNILYTELLVRSQWIGELGNVSV